MSKRVTVEQVAAHAGVSTSTVRNVVSGRAEVVSPATRARVEAAIDELGYSPVRRVMSRRFLEETFIGFEIARPGDAPNPIFTSTLLELNTAARDSNCRLIAFTTSQEPERLSDYRQVWQSGLIEGFIFSDPHFQDDRITYLREAGIPFVVIGRSEREDDYCWTDVDDRRGIVMAVNHLVDKGHDHIGLVSWAGPIDKRSATGDPVAQRRGSGYKDALLAHGLEIMTADGTTYRESAVENCMELLRRTPRPTAIVATCDEFASDALEAARTLDLEVPHDLAIVGFDDSVIARRAHPRLTSVRQPIAEVARAAISLLLQVRKDRSFHGSRLIEPELVVRESS